MLLLYKLLGHECCLIYVHQMHMMCVLMRGWASRNKTCIYLRKGRNGPRFMQRGVTTLTDLAVFRWDLVHSLLKGLRMPTVVWRLWVPKGYERCRCRRVRIVGWRERMSKVWFSCVCVACHLLTFLEEVESRWPVFRSLNHSNRVRTSAELSGKKSASAKHRLGFGGLFKIGILILRHLFEVSGTTFSAYLTSSSYIQYLAAQKHDNDIIEPYLSSYLGVQWRRWVSFWKALIELYQ